MPAPWTSPRRRSGSGQAVEARADLLVEASHQIHEHPELNYEEQFAHDLLTGLLADEGLEVERHAYGLDTAFVARAGTHRAHDRRAVRVRRAARHRPRLRAQHHRHRRPRGRARRGRRSPRSSGGRVVVMGTPAEEGGGGKILMARAGAFEGVDAALMVHPAGLRPGPHGRDRRAGAHRHLHGRGRARRGLPAPAAATRSTPRCSAT